MRDSAEENSLSKAVLRCSADKMTADGRVSYFPSFEIMMDELRDYRWYDRDLVHPSPPAVDYIADRFAETVGSERFLAFWKRAGELSREYRHRPVLPESAEWQEFTAARERKRNTLAGEFPRVDGLKKKNGKK
jgi:hypothetical protein